MLYVIVSIVGFFAMGYVPSKVIVHGDAASTANNIATRETLFRLGIAGELIGQAGFIFVALALYAKESMRTAKRIRRRYENLAGWFWPQGGFCFSRPKSAFCGERIHHL